MWLSETAAIVIPPARVPWLPGWKTYLTRTALFPTASQRLWTGVASRQTSQPPSGRWRRSLACLAALLRSVETDSKFIFTSVRLEKKIKGSLVEWNTLLKSEPPTEGSENTTAAGVSPPRRQRRLGAKAGGGGGGAGGGGLNTEPLFSPAKCRSLHIPATAVRKTGLSSCGFTRPDELRWLGMRADVDTTGVIPLAGDIIFQCDALIAVKRNLEIADLWNTVNAGCYRLLQVKSVRNPNRWRAFFFFNFIYFNDF